LHYRDRLDTPESLLTDTVYNFHTVLGHPVGNREYITSGALYETTCKTCKLRYTVAYENWGA
jgi:hypothetical protein